MDHYRICSHCAIQKRDDEFSWSDAQHHYRDSRCRVCEAFRRKQTRKPRHTVKPYRFPYGLTDTMHGHLSAIELAYIAGLIDGEGSLWSSQPKTNKSPLNLVVTMVHKPTIKWLHEHCGGMFMARRSNQPNARQGWCWHLKGARTTSLLKRLLPYMVTKREEANVALQLGESLWGNNIRGRVPEITLATRRHLGQVLRNLKRQEWPV